MRHMVLEISGPKCGCGNRGCFEALASRTAIFRRIKEAAQQGQKTILTDMLGPDLEGLRSGDLRKAIERGDKFVEHMVEEAAEYAGIAVANLINLFSPEVVTIGGGLMEQLEGEMLAIIVETAKDYAMLGTTEDRDYRHKTGATTQASSARGAASNVSERLRSETGCFNIRLTKPAISLKRRSKSASLLCSCPRSCFWPNRESRIKIRVESS